MSDKDTKAKEELSRLGLALLIGATAALTFCFFSVSEVFAANRGELLFAFRDFAPGILLAALLLAGCGAAEYNDGTYTAQSSVYEGLEDEDGDEGGDGYGVVTITLRDNVIVDCEFTTYMLDGTVKDENYGTQNGEIANQDYYNKAQKAVAACDEYASMLVANGSLDGIDAISGATINYKEFVEAVNNALDQAVVKE